MCQQQQLGHNAQLLLLPTRQWTLVWRHFSWNIDCVTFTGEHALIPLRNFTTVSVLVSYILAASVSSQKILTVVWTALRITVNKLEKKQVLIQICESET